MKGLTISIMILLATALIAGCGGVGPTAPPQMPVSVEGLTPASVEPVAGVAEGDMPVQSGKAVQFVVKDENGDEIDDPTVVNAELVLPDGTAIESLSSDPGISVSSKAATNSACYGAADTSDTYWEITPSERNFDPDNNNTMCVRFTNAESGEVLNEYCMLVSVDPDDVEDGTYAFEEVGSVEGLTVNVVNGSYNAGNPDPDIASDGIAGVYICYNDGDAVYTISSADGGEKWSDPMKIANTGGGCAVSAAKGSDIGTVAIGWVNSALSSFVAVSTDYGVSYTTETDPIPGSLEEIRYSEVISSSTTIASTNLSEKAAESSSQPVLHIIASASDDCDPSPVAGLNMFYFTYDNGTISDPAQVNPEAYSCLVNTAQRASLAVDSTEENIYVQYRDIRDRPTPDARVNDMEMLVARLNSSGVFQNEFQLIGDVDASNDQAAEGYITVDKNDLAINSWVHRDYGSDTRPFHTYFSIGNDTGTTFTDYLLQTIPFSEYESFVPGNEVYWWHLYPSYGRTYTFADYSNAYHLFYNDLEGMKYSVGTLADSELTTTSEVLLSDSVVGKTSGTVNYAGISYVVYEAASSIRILRGALPECGE